jgi:hypothetical protein
MKELSLDDSVTIGPNVVFRELDGEAVLLNLDAGVYYGLDAVGTTMWHRLAQDGSLRRAAEAMLREFDVDRATVERDLLRLVNELCDQGLTVASGTAPAA